MLIKLPPHLEVAVERGPNTAGHGDELEPLAPEDETSVVVLHGTPDGEGLSGQQQQLASHVQLDLLGAPQLYEGVVLGLLGWQGVEIRVNQQFVLLL